MLGLESPIITETRDLLELSSVGNVSVTSDADQLKNWLLKENQSSVFYSSSQVSNNIRINSLTADKEEHQTLIREIFQYDKPTHRIIKNKTGKDFTRLPSLSIPHPDRCLSERYLRTFNSRYSTASLDSLSQSFSVYAVLFSQCLTYLSLAAIQPVVFYLIYYRLTE